MIKFIGAIIGFLVFRFPGAIIGYLIGSLFDGNISLEKDEPANGKSSFDSEEFSYSFLVLTASVLKADGNVTRNELEFVKELYKQNFGIEKTKSDMLKLRDILNSHVNIDNSCLSINQKMIKSEKVKLIHYLFGIAQADGSISNNELSLIKIISQKINISQWDFEAIKMKFTYSESYSSYDYYTKQTSNTNSYKELGIDKNASDDEIKKTYRKLARQYHPDKHASKSPTEIKNAEEKFKKIQQAYNQIKKERDL